MLIVPDWHIFFAAIAKNVIYKRRRAAGNPSCFSNYNELNFTFSKRQGSFCINLCTVEKHILKSPIRYISKSFLILNSSSSSFSISHFCLGGL